MARLSSQNIGSVQVQEPAPIIVTKDRSWMDYLPQGCELPQLFQTGKSLDSCLELCNLTEAKLNKKCKATCKTTCKQCHKCWVEATSALILQQQINKASKGDSAMLTWTGKAILRQTEPVVETDEVVPTQVNILGLNINQESEIDQLRRELKALRAQLPPKNEEVIDATDTGHKTE